MEKKMVLKWTKGLLALVLAFLMLFGNGMDVFAATEYCVVDGCTCGRTKISEGAIVHGGDTIHILGSHVAFAYIDNYYTYSMNGYVTLTGESGKKYRYDHVEKSLYDTDRYEYRHYFVTYIAPETEPAASPVAQPIENDTGHEHSYEWVEAFEPSVSGDGLMQHRCSCGAVDDQYTIPGSLAYLRMFCAAIQNAPENGTVEWNPYAFRCYTRRMMEELAKRPDVTLRTTYTEADGTTKSFTIPAGQALTDEELFYGFTYLGNLYGWN